MILQSGYLLLTRVLEVIPGISSMLHPSQIVRLISRDLKNKKHSSYVECQSNLSNLKRWQCSISKSLTYTNFIMIVKSRRFWHAKWEGVQRFHKVFTIIIGLFIVKTVSTGRLKQFQKANLWNLCQSITSICFIYHNYQNSVRDFLFILHNYTSWL